MDALRVTIFFLFCAVALTRPASALPAGEGRDLVEGICTGCHATNRISRSSGYDGAGWRELIATMIDLSDAPQERDQIVGYLATHFPPHSRKAPNLVPGDASISFVEWVVPTLGQRPRDPVEADDGTVWWAGQWGNLIGHLDPATGRMREYDLPEDTKPHSVTLDREGNVWFTGNRNATMGRLDPRSGKITIYPMPDPAARDPHTAIFDADGILWITLQHSNMIGRLDPSTGEVRLVTAPTLDSRPYGIKIDRHGVPWVACNGSNCLLRVDPETMELKEFRLPDAGSTVRRLDIAGDGMIWFVNSSLGRLGRLDPRTGAIREWPSPSGAKSHPYAIAVVDGIVWYNESGKRPDTLVRFDPATEGFQSWAIPSGGIHSGIIRHMRATRNGDLLAHQSATNRIILIRLGR